MRLKYNIHLARSIVRNARTQFVTSKYKMHFTIPLDFEQELLVWVTTLVSSLHFNVNIQPLQTCPKRSLRGSEKEQAFII